MTDSVIRIGNLMGLDGVLYERSFGKGKMYVSLVIHSE